MSPVPLESECTPHAQCRGACTGPHSWYNTGDGIGSLKYWCEGPRPIVSRSALDRAAVREEIRAGLNRALCNGGHPASETGWSPSDEVDRATDAVMALAVPVPTEDQIAEAIYAARQAAVGQLTDLGYAKAVLALLNGGAR